MNTRGKLFHLGGIIIFFCTLSLCAQATLIIGLYNNSRVYVGVDSRYNQEVTGKIYIGQKIFKLNDFCCVAMSGYYGPMVAKNGNQITAVLPSILDAICSTSPPPEAVVSQMHAVYTNRFADCGATMLVFAGYERAKEMFFFETYKFDGTNAIRVQKMYCSDEIAKKSFAGGGGKPNFSPLIFIGRQGTNDTSLLDDLVIKPLRFEHSPEKLRNLASDGFKQSLALIRFSQDLSEDEATDFVFECFQVDYEHAKELGYAHGFVGPPFILYKIATNGVVLLRRDN